METYLVRLKPFEPRRGFVLKRFTYAGIKFYGERGWYRVEKPVAEYLRAVRAVGDTRAWLGRLYLELKKSNTTKEATP